MFLFLGAGWLLGFRLQAVCQSDMAKEITSYLCILINGLQGLFVLIFYAHSKGAPYLRFWDGFKIKRAHHSVYRVTGGRTWKQRWSKLFCLPQPPGKKSEDRGITKVAELDDRSYLPPIPRFSSLIQRSSLLPVTEPHFSPSVQQVSVFTVPTVKSK